MSTADNPHTTNDDPPPAYYDGAIERLPSYRGGYLRRYHPYGRYTPSLYQRIMLSPYAYDFNYVPAVIDIDAIIGLQALTGTRTTGSSALSVGDHSVAPVASSSSSAEAGPSETAAAPHVALSSFTVPSERTTSTSRPAKRKREDFEREGDPE